MTVKHPSDRLATGVLLFSASLWGLSWVPLKWFIAQGLSGPVVSLLSYGLVGLCALPFIWRDRAAWRSQWGFVLALALVGGWANTSFVNALMLGDVVRVMFLFYLSPVWSVLGGWLFLKERIPPSRWAAVVAAIVGLWLVLGGPGALSLSLGFVDFLALSAGFAFAANNILARAAQAVPMRTKTLSVFVGCGAISLAATSALGHGVPAMGALVWFGILAYGFGWLLLATATWQFGVTHLESSRAGVILLAELVVAVLTALWFGGESLTPMGWAGGALIATAALVEALGSSGAESPAPGNDPSHATTGV
ncbi:MAG: DMT family transporter [Hydrogenophaga sp.]|jgi:drug/metabolite transporter (DMT)-like permease|uniref:DMT family transporter n=1 Tax=Hydrogenophaga sp. TaxID=1904254 RepID=UPI002731E06F|nr:DMT family transporter [Hydrogenophaga sp.]MDP2407261.1 DMT family transporter [Hydrogenophaga sp.]MDZ4175811.1 DMT family transporter [Hydrogenophaga sp.]